MLHIVILDVPNWRIIAYMIFQNLSLALLDLVLYKEWLQVNEKERARIANPFKEGQAVLERRAVKINSR